jgi:signal transduction histidine kinase
MATLTGADYGSLFLVDASGRVMPAFAALHQRAPARQQELASRVMDKGLAGWVARHRQVALIHDTDADERWLLATNGGYKARSALAVPIVSGSTLLGVLTLTHSEVGRFSSEHVYLLQAAADQMALAVRNAWLYQSTVDERRRLLTVLESSRDGILFVGTDGRMRVVNTHALALLGLPGAPEAWMERPLSEALVALVHRARGTARVALSEIRRIQSGDQAAGEGESEVAPRTLHWVNLPVLSDATTLGRLVVLRDVTEERQVERMRDDLIHTMVHDLRNPLTSLSVALDLLGQPQAGKLSSHQRVMLDYAKGGLQRTLTLVTNILDVSRLESRRMPLACAAVALSDLVAETLSTQALLAAQKGLRLESDVPSTLPFVWADGQVVDRVLQNLIGNACKFTPEGGLIRVTAEVAVDAEDGQDTPISHVLLSVSDTGPGIPPELQDRLFQKFVTGRQQGSGSGLGLAFCRLAIEAHEGRLWVESEPGRGTTFHLTLPVADAEGQVDTTSLRIDDLHIAAAHSRAEQPG